MTVNLGRLRKEMYQLSLEEILTCVCKQEKEICWASDLICMVQQWSYCDCVIWKFWLFNLICLKSISMLDQFSLDFFTQQGKNMIYIFYFLKIPVQESVGG